MTSSPQRRTILVAEDQAGQRAVIDLLLSVDGYDLVIVEDGKEALEWLKGNTPHLAILDVQMPFVDGIDVCRRLKAVKRLTDVPVIILTAMRDEGTLDRAEAAGAQAVIHKPLEGKDFRETVRRLIAGPVSKNIEAEDYSFPSER